MATLLKSVIDPFGISLKVKFSKLNFNDIEKRRISYTILPPTCKTQGGCPSYFAQGKVLVERSVIHLTEGLLT